MLSLRKTRSMEKSFWGVNPPGWVASLWDDVRGFVEGRDEDCWLDGWTSV